MATDIKYVIRSILLADSAVFNLLGTRIYPLPLPAEKTYPLAGVHVVSTGALSSHSGSSKLGNPTRVQLDLWYDTDTAGVLLRDEVKRVLQDFRGTVTIGLDSVRIDRIQWSNEVELDDPDTGKRYRPIDLRCWHSTPT